MQSKNEVKRRNGQEIEFTINEGEKSVIAQFKVIHRSNQPTPTRQKLSENQNNLFRPAGKSSLMASQLTLTFNKLGNDWYLNIEGVEYSDLFRFNIQRIVNMFEKSVEPNHCIKRTLTGSEMTIRSISTAHNSAVTVDGILHMGFILNESMMKTLLDDLETHEHVSTLQTSTLQQGSISCLRQALGLQVPRSEFTYFS